MAIWKEPPDKRTPEEKAAEQASRDAQKKAERIANRSCPLLVFYYAYEGHEYAPGILGNPTDNLQFKDFSGFKKSKCMGIDCRWWSLSDNECYILLACKKMLNER
jgi:hypothetical protein